MESQIISLRSQSLSFTNVLKDDVVKRPNLVQEVEDLLDSKCKMVIVEGNEGSGKTDILLQFAMKHLFDCFTYFITPSFRLSYKQDYFLEDLGRQLYFYNKGEIAPSDWEVSEGIFNKLIFDLVSSRGKKSKSIFIVLDGLDQIDKADFDLLKSSLENLPWNINNIYFIISGTLETLKLYLPSAWIKDYKSIRIPRFLEEETFKLFNLEPTESNNKFVREVHETWKGNPENLCQVRRIISNGISIEDFLSSSSISEKNDLLDLEWKRANLIFSSAKEVHTFVCGVLAFDDNIRSIDRMASILEMTSEELISLIEKIPFLRLNSSNVNFVSGSLREYAKTRLRKFENEIISILIKYYQNNDDINSITTLPTLFQKKEDWKSVIELLTIDNIETVIRNSKSFSEIKKQINFGYNAANKLKKSYENLFRFSLHRSIVSSLQSSDSQLDKIKSYIVLEKQEEALNLILSVVLKEDRFRMLVVFLQYSKRFKKDIDDHLIDEVKELIKEIDLGFIKENLPELAIGLAHFLPSEATKLVERAIGQTNKSASIEWLTGIIGIIAHENRELEPDNDHSLDSDRKYTHSYSNKFVQSIGYGISNLTYDEVNLEITSMESVSDKIYLLKRWIQTNIGNKNILQAIDLALHLITTNSDQSKPTTDTLHDIVSPIVNLENREIANQY